MKQKLKRQRREDAAPAQIIQEALGEDLHSIILEVNIRVDINEFISKLISNLGVRSLNIATKEKRLHEAEKQIRKVSILQEEIKKLSLANIQKMYFFLLEEIDHSVKLQQPSWETSHLEIQFEELLSGMLSGFQGLLTISQHNPSALLKILNEKNQWKISLEKIKFLFVRKRNNQIERELKLLEQRENLFNTFKEICEKEILSLPRLETSISRDDHKASDFSSELEIVENKNHQKFTEFELSVKDQKSRDNLEMNLKAHYINRLKEQCLFVQSLNVEDFKMLHDLCNKVKELMTPQITDWLKQIKILQSNYLQQRSELERHQESYKHPKFIEIWQKSSVRFLEMIKVEKDFKDPLEKETQINTIAQMAVLEGEKILMHRPLVTQTPAQISVSETIITRFQFTSSFSRVSSLPDQNQPSNLRLG